MASLEEQFEQAFTEIILDESGRHLLEAEAVTECVVSGETVTVTLDLPPDQALRQSISGRVEDRCRQIPGISNVNVRMADQGQPEPQPAASGPGAGAQPRTPQRPQRQTYLDNYSAVVAVGSGKGGVGKSTVAVNLAIALAEQGLQTSLFDADIYGPSVPIMMGLRNSRPKMEADNTIVPLEKYGLNVMSIGNLVEEAAATVWRGPIVHQVIDQLLRETRWPGGDVMVIDLPPGTGDAPLTLSQLLALAGAVIVTTPQDVALLDAIKAVGMFHKVDVPVLGLVENMSSFVCPHCGEESAIFDKGNAERAASQNNIPFLGRIPIELALREGGDTGRPVMTAHPESLGAQAFRHIAQRLVEELERGG